jgi:hypothetical protein
VTFIGFTVGRGSVDKESSKVEEVRNWPVPGTIRDVWAFLGLAWFYRRFVHKFAEIARPLKELEQENTHMVIRVTTKDGTKHKVLEHQGKQA